MQIENYTEDSKTSEFYPTPSHLIEKMLDGINWYKVDTVLEPSAGKGDIVRAIGKKMYAVKNSVNIDCIEIDNNLRQILKYNLTEKKINEISEKQDHLRNKYNNKLIDFNDYYKKNEDYRKRLSQALEIKKGSRIVHNDFLTYNPFNKYDLIVMNPPFSNGDKHLLKAIDIQKHGGSIICLLNAETLRNPYTESRKKLVALLDEYNADIKYLKDEFTSAERKTNVEIALIKLSIPETDNEMSIFERLQQEEKYEELKDAECTDLEVSDYIKAAINRYKLEIKAGIELIREYNRLKPFIYSSLDEKDRYGHSLLKLTVGYNNCDYKDVNINDYVAAVRLKYWKALLENKKFIGKLTSELKENYCRRVTEFAKYDFSEFNIHNLSLEMQTEIKSGIEEEAMKMFDRLTNDHCYNGDCKSNKYLFSGWKTNKAHKIDKKSILPCYDVFSTFSSSLSTYKACECLSDIERVLNFFAGNMTAGVDLEDAIAKAFNAGKTVVNCKYFKATFYKKGTVHIEYNCPELIARYNIFAAKNRNWLPPTYGKVDYKDMTDEEKSIIDSFQGEENYNKVINNAAYYLTSPTSNNLLALVG